MKIENNNKNIVKVIVVFILGALCMYGVVHYYPDYFTVTKTKLEKSVTVTDTGIADAVEKVYDSVVIISAYKKDTLVSSGTGFVYKTDDNKAYLLTNYHVIESGTKVTATFTDGTVVETEIVGSDKYSDISVLSLAKNKIISVAEIGSSNDIRVGDTSFAVGAPLNSAYSWTVTRGIISGKDRMVEVSLSSSTTSDYVMKVIQTDTAINSGNSGGPLCNANGEVIGITSLKLVSSGVEGMGFAIPIENAVDTANKIMSGEKNDTPYLGVSILDLSTAYYYQEYYNVIQDSGLSKGIIVVEIEKDSAADKGGLEEKDIIVKIDDVEISSVAYFRYTLYQYKVGDKIKVTVNRDGKEKELEITIGTNKSTT